jgi:hypothetical protein
LTWITDQDEFVANDARHDDALVAAARVSPFYVPHPMGVFALNTTGQDPEAPVRSTAVDQLLTRGG